MTNNKTKIEQCSFEYVCPKTWGNLLETNIATVRFCDSCERNVYLSSSTDEAQKNAKLGRCVAIPILLSQSAEEEAQETHIVGDMNPPRKIKPIAPPRKIK